MAQYFNVVTNANGSFTLEDIQLCQLEGQSVQFVVEDINNGANVISQQILIPASSDSTESTVISQPAIISGAHVATAQLDPRSGIYIIDPNDSQIIQQTVYTKEESDDSVKGTKDQLNVCYAGVQGDWISSRENNESIGIIIKKDPSPVKNVVTNSVRNQQITTTQIPTSNVLVQNVSDKKVVTRLVPVNKRPAVSSTSAGILRTTLQGQNSPTIKVNKMRRASNVSSPNVTVARSRASTGVVGTNQVLTSPRGPQARPPIHSDTAQRNSLQFTKNAPNLPPPELNQLSERIKQANLKQRQQLLNDQRQPQKKVQQPMLAVSPMQRTSQATQAINVQRRASMGQLMNRQQLQLQQIHQQQQLTQLQQQQLLQRHAVTTVVSVAQPSRQAIIEVEQPMDIDPSDNVQLEKLNSLNCTSKADSEENSSESFAYLQQEIEDPQTAIVQQQITGNEAKMLVILENGEQRLITFEVPKEDCTVQDLLEQANIYASQEPRVSLVSDPALGINYIVDVTPRSTEESMESVPSETTNVTLAEPKTPIKPNTSMTSQTGISPRASRFVDGMLAVCPYCGMSATDFNYCLRCKRKLPDNVKAIAISSGSKKENVDTFYKKDAVAQKAEAIAKRGRGGMTRGRGVARTRQVKEPECLTISSDEEDETKKQKSLDNSKEKTNSSNTVTSKEAETILEKEPVITNNCVIPNTIVSMSTSSGGKEQGIFNDKSHLSIYLTCRTVRIGSYKYIPNENVHLSSNGLKLKVPCLEDEKDFIPLDIKIENLVKVLIHFNKSMPVLFFYTTPATALMIRDLLGMQDPKGPYFDPTSMDQTHKRITLLPEEISDEAKLHLKLMYKPIFEELNTKEANEILVKASPTAIPAPSKKTANSSNSNGVIQTITVYPPPPAKGGIAINTEDFICLGEDQFLNDVIIDFYLKYLTLEVLSKNDHDRTHVFSSYFYKRLTSPHTQAAENTENLSPASKRHARVQKWTKNVNIFEKDFVVIPINEHAHWFLAIVCFPGLVGTVSPKIEVKTENQKLQEKKKKDAKAQSVLIGSTTITPVNTITIDNNDDGSERDEAEGDDDEMETDSDEDDESESKPEQSEKIETPVEEKKEITKVPCILIFDSLAGASRSRVVATLRDYLSCEYQAKMGSEKIFSKDTIKGACPKVPQQSNFTDCGLYVLQYVESFFQVPITDYTLPIKTLKSWFEEIVVTRKREDIAKLLIQLVNKTKGDKTINLPILTFPTHDGKMKLQKADSQIETRALKTEIESKKKAAEAGESKSNTSTTPMTESSESSNESSSKGGSSQTDTPSSSQSSSTTDGKIVVQKESTTPTTTRSSVDTMAFLKTKRIPRLQKSSDNPEDKQVAKKHKGDSFDSCK